MDLIRTRCGRWVNRGLVSWGLLGLAVMAGCSDKYKPSLSDDEARKFSAKQKPVPPPMLAVSGETLTVDTIRNYRAGGTGSTLGDHLTYVAQNTDPDRFREVASKQIRTTLDNLIDETLLYQQAKREGGDKMKDGLAKAADQEWRRFVLEHGGDEAAAEEALRKLPTPTDRKGFKDQNKRMILVRYLVSLRLPMDQPVSHREMVEVYHRMKDKEFAIKPRLTFRLIDIQPGGLQLTDLTMDRHAQAQQMARNVMDKLATGEDFGELARQYSHDPMASSGGLWSSVDPQSLADPYDGLAAKAAGLAVGQVEGPIEMKGHLFIVRLEGRQEQGYQPLDQVQAKIEDRIRADRYRQAMDKIEADLAERAKVGQTTEFINGCVEEILRRSKAAP